MKEQVSFKALLKDPVYKAWVMKPPRDESHLAHHSVWVVRYKVTKRWECKTFTSYTKAFNWAVKNMSKFQDLAIGSTHKEFRPPVVRTGTKEVKVKKIDPRTQEVSIVTQKVPVRKYLTQLPGRLPAEHNWCGYCRRPTVFGFFKRHHAQKVCVPYVKRCRICGVRLSFLGKWSH